MKIRVNLDTNSLNNRALLHILRSSVKTNKCEVLISPIVGLEYGYFQYLHGKLGKFKLLTKELKLRVIPIVGKDVFGAIKHALIQKDDTGGATQYFRDSLIAAQSERLQIPVVTHNIKDFRGLPGDLLKTPEEIIKLLV